MSSHNSVVDLRQYTVVPGRRDELIDMFDSYFVDGQAAAGIHVIGLFRDLDDPDRLVWLRGFESMPRRKDALSSFYYGPVWQEHRDAANATMVDSDNVLLLEPLLLGPDFPEYGDERTDGAASGVVAVTVAHLAGPVTQTDRELAFYLHSVLVELGTDVAAAFVTHNAENTFPALPVRNEHVLVWITRFPDDASYAAQQERLADSDVYRDAQRRIAERSKRVPSQHLRLRPTTRSQLR